MYYKDQLNNSLGDIDENTKLLLTYFEKLNDKEKEYFLCEMNTRILKKELDEK